MTVEHVERTRVAWVDTDAGGRIHFTAAFRWAELAETGIRRKLGLIEEWGSYPRRKVEAEFLQVLVFEDEIEVRIHPDELELKAGSTVKLTSFTSGVPLVEFWMPRIWWLIMGQGPVQVV